MEARRLIRPSLIGYLYIVWPKLGSGTFGQVEKRTGSSNMAGPIRHPVDQVALERYISDNVAEIKLPIDLKQVRVRTSRSANMMKIPPPPPKSRLMS